MATSFKTKAVEELRKAKQLEREAEATAHAQSKSAKYAKNVVNEKRIADKMARIEKGEEPVVVVEKVAEEVQEVQEAVVEEVVEEVVEKPKAKAKSVTKKKGRPAKAKK
tara:strand:- start:259 stop:585 length:327 start_codon:yes stop_codon:yes gene_type:complete